MARNGDSARAQARAAMRKFGNSGQLIWLGAGALFMVLLAFRSCVTVEPGHVAVRVNNITGKVETITQPGVAERNGVQPVKAFVLNRLFDKVACL